MAHLTPDFINEVRRANDIVDVISVHVNLRQRGQNLVGRCPFHDDRTPSFSVSPEKQLFYCFGCQTGGDVFDFVARRDSVSFAEAVLNLASRAGLKAPEERHDANDTGRQARERLYAVMEAAARFFRKVLLETANPAIAYLDKRGVTTEIAERFYLGYAPDRWDALLTVLEKQGYPVEVAIGAGLAAKGQDGRVYDRFRSRLMFPIRDEQGRVVGFGGRVLGDGVPKYLNSPETALFNKRRNWFGLDLAKGEIRREDRAVVVEGYMDVITAHQYGFTNTIASLGTALSQEQVAAARRHCSEVVIAYDADSAGEMATVRGLELFRQGGCGVKVARVPEGKDPDEYLRSKGAESFRRVLREALPIVEYVYETAVTRHDISTVEGKVGVVREVVPHLAVETSAVARGAYINSISARLGIPEESLREEIASHRRRMKRLAKDGEGYKNRKDCHNSRGLGVIMSLSPASGDSDVEKRLVGLLLRWPELVRSLKPVLEGTELEDPQCRRVIDLLMKTGDSPDITGVVLAHEGDEGLRRLIASLAMDDTDYPEPMRAARDLLGRIEKRRLQHRLKEITQELEILTARGLPIPVGLGEEWQELQRKVRGVNR